MRFALTSRALCSAAPPWAAVSLRSAICRCAPSVHHTITPGTCPRRFQSSQQWVQDSTQIDTKWQPDILSVKETPKIIKEDLGKNGSKKSIVITGQAHELDGEANLSTSILPHLDRRLYLSEDHPICITKALVESAFPPPTYRNLFALNPVVSTELNFDVLGFPADHPGRSKTDTYYLSNNTVLRTHTSAHEDESFRNIGAADRHGENLHDGYTLIADVYRRDSIDRSHYPVFHQMEGARTWRFAETDSPAQRIAVLQKDLDKLGNADLEVQDVDAFTSSNPMQTGRHNPVEAELIAKHLKGSLEHLVVKIIRAARQARAGAGSLEIEEPIKARWVEAYFPFTAPSYELEVWWKGEWLELLGCGVTQQTILDNAGIPDRIGWAWGIGIERLAMLLFGIPDIRLFWSEDARFLGQFKKGIVSEFKPFSRYPTCFKDVAFWIDLGRSPNQGTTHPSASNASTTNQGPGAAAPAGGHLSNLNDPPPPSSETFHENDLMEVVRDLAGSLVEDVQLVDDFKHPKTGRRSLCYRINYRSLERTLTNEETNDLHEQVRAKLSGMGLELR